MAYQTVLTLPVTLLRAGVIEIDGIAIQNFASGNAAYGFRLLVDGNIIFDTGYHTAPTDIVPIGGMYAAAVGQHTVTLQWAGDASITLSFAFLKAKGFNGADG